MIRALWEGLAELKGQRSPGKPKICKGSWSTARDDGVSSTPPTPFPLAPPGVGGGISEWTWQHSGGPIICTATIRRCSPVFNTKI
ncbi:hypothetical protein [Arcticibacter tournemirensis]|uniref:hypothetical protein n=1 Tax=Arcticibacter tournemirensis TaxID=699437 RepID=UPI001386909F|nr:hypothetical protein [Arcticibacter tournemirensis]